MKNLSYILLLICIVLGTTLASAQYLSINPTGNSNIKIKKIKEAGDGYPNNYKPGKKKAKMSVWFYNSFKNNHQNWQIQVSKSDIYWDDTMEIWVKGKKKNGITSGFNQFKKVKNWDTDFLGGKGKVMNFQIEYQIRGISVAIPADFYCTELIFTIFEE